MAEWGTVSQKLASGATSLSSGEEEAKRRWEKGNITREDLRDALMSMGGASGGTIAQYARSPFISPQFKKALEWIMKKYPRISNLTRESIIHPETSLNAGFPYDAVGEYNPVANRSRIFLKAKDPNSWGGAERIPDVKDALRTVGHEDFGHSVEQARRVKRFGAKGASELQATEHAMPYEQRPGEIMANRRGEQLLEALRRNKVLTDEELAAKALNEDPSFMELLDDVLNGRR